MRSFAAPQMFWLLLILVAPLSVFLWWEWRRRQQLMQQFISSRLLANLKVGVSPMRQKVRMVLFVAAVVLLIVAMARPQWGSMREEAHQRGLDIVVAIDTSNSMLAEDVSPNRLTRAKLAAMDLMRKAKTDRLGLVAFAGDAFLECPLTLDDAAFSQSVEALDTKTISQGGTAIAPAIEEARKAFKDESDNHRVLVLFTDGEDHDTESATAAEKAAKDGMIIFTIGIGTAEGELLRVRGENGQMDYIRDEQGQPVKSHLNEDLLRQIAQATKGFYLPLRGTKTMDTLYDQGIAPLPQTERSVKLFQTLREQYHWFLGAAILLLLVELFLPESTRRRSRNSPPASSGAGKEKLAEAVAVLLLLAVPVAAHGSPGSALREYNEGKYQDALRDYNKLLEMKKDDPRLHFNAGTAAYQSKQYQEATNQLNEALSSQDLQLQQRAYYNLGNSLYRLGQQDSDPSKKQEMWENALKHYGSALKLNQQDSDAKFNQDYVTKELEELKKQQQQQQSQSDKNSDKQKKDKEQQNQQANNDSQKNQQQNKQDQQNQQNQQNQQQDRNQSGQDQKSQAKNQDQKDKPNQDQQKQDQAKAQDQKQKDEKDKQSAQQQASNKENDKSEEEKREAAMMAAGEMTPQQAQQLLDSEKGDEQVLHLSPTNRNSSLSRSYKNW